MSPRLLSMVQWAAALSTCAILATDAAGGLRGPESWRWARRLLAPSAPLALSIVLFALTVFLARRIRGWASRASASVASPVHPASAPPSRRVWFLAIAAAALLVFAQMITLTAADPGGLSHLERRVLDPSFTSYATIAKDVSDPVKFLREYPRLQDRFPVHGPSQPPGRVLFFWGVNQIVHASPESEARLAALLLMLAGSLCVFPLAALVGGRERPAAVAGAILLFACVPSIMLFTPQTDHLILLLTLSSAAFLMEACRGERSGSAASRAAAFAFVGGFIAGGAMFVSLTSIAAVGTWGLAIGGGAASGAGAKRIARVLLAAVAGFLAAIAIPAALGMNWPEVIRECVEGAHRIQVLIFKRQYSEWVGWNLVDYALFLGPALAIAATASAFEEFRAMRTRKGASGAATAASRATIPFALAMFAALAVLDLSGKIVGETGRIWMFLMPFAALAAATALEKHPARATVSLAVAQFLVALTIKMTLGVPG